MKKENKMPRWYSPFDDSAGVRLRRMGLLNENGKPGRQRIKALGEVFAGQFFDDLYDFRQDAEAAEESLGNFLKDAEGATAKYRFLLVCMQYDATLLDDPSPTLYDIPDMKKGATEELGMVDLGDASYPEQSLEDMRSGDTLMDEDEELPPR